MGTLWAYVGQPDHHTGNVTSMPFASTYFQHPRKNPWNFGKKILVIDGIEKQIGQNFFDDYPGLQLKTTPAQKYATQCMKEAWTIS